MKLKDYYEIMEVTSNASFDEIKQAYHRLARKFHPDISKEPDAEQRFKEINEAYEVLKDPQKRAAYNSSFKLILPYTYAWFIAKKNAWMRANAQLRAKKNAGMRAQFLGRSTKTDAGVSAHGRHSTEDNNMKSTQKFPLLLMGTFVLVLSAITMAVIFAVEQFGQWQNHQQLQVAILQGEETAIRALEHSDIEIQRKILEDEQIKKAVIQFYLQQTNRPIFVLLETYDQTIETEMLRNDEVYRLLKTHYYHQIENEMEADNFNQALSLLETLQNKYPNESELSDYYEKIENQKQQRLAELTQQYTECLEQTLAPLLKRTHCMMEARRKIEYVGIEHHLPSDSNLSTMYAEEIKHALAKKNFDQVEKLLSDWQTLLPAPSLQRDKFQEDLALYRQFKSIIADLSGYDKNKIVTRLSQVIAVPTLQQELLERPHLQDNLLRYHLKEALALATTTLRDGEVNIDLGIVEDLERALKGVRESTRNQSVQPMPWYADSTLQPSSSQTNQEVANLLQECQTHYAANRLTTGTPNTALNCYTTVLEKDPNNLDAVAGLKAIENRYKRWAEYALKQGKLDKVRRYLVSLEKVNPDSQIIVQLKKRLKGSMRQSKSNLPPAKVFEAPQPLESMSCEDCNCSDLLKQLSLGVKPLTAVQNNFLQSQCR